MDGLYDFASVLFWVILGIMVWQMPWKAVALWKAGRNRHVWWFVAIFLVNTLAILEIVYIFAFSKQRGGQKA